MPSLWVAPYRQIAEEVAARLEAGRAGLDPLAPWAEEVIVPSRGVAESITTALLRRFPRGMAGLRIHSLETLARRIVNAAGETPRVALPEERRLAMRTVARSLEEPLAESRGIAAMLERSYRDVRDAAVSTDDVARRAGRERRLRNARRTESVLRAWQEYERLIGRLGAIDPSDLILRAAQLAGPATPPQLLAGFYDMTGAQLALVRALLAAGRIAGAWSPTGGPFAQPMLGALGELTREGPAAPSPLPTAVSSRHDTRADEIEAVCASVAGAIAAGADPSSIAITARSFEPYDVRLLNRFATAHGFRTTLAEPLPLRAHRIGRAAATLLRLRDRGFPRADVLELVRDGLRTRTRLRVDAVDVATRKARVAGGTSAELRRLSGRSRPLDDYLALVAELEERTADPAEALARSSDLFRIETESGLEAAAALDEIAALFRRAAIWNRPLDLASVLDAIEQKEIASPSSPDRDAPLVWAGDVMRFRGRSFERTFVLRMEDDVFPQRRLEDPLLPDSDRRLLGLREIGDGAAEERLLLSLLFDSTSAAIRFSHAGGDGFGKVLRGSRYVRGMSPAFNIQHSTLNIQHSGFRLNVESGRRPAPAPSTRQLQLLAHRGRGGVFDGIVGPLEGALAARLESLSPTQLEDFGECPQKFLLKHVLGAEDLEHPERELQIHHREKGTIDHRILERFYRSAPHGEIEAAIAVLPRLPDQTRRRLESLIDEQFDALEAEAPAFNATVRGIERRATKRLLRDFVVRDLADLAATGLRPRWFEYRFGAKHGEAADHPAPYLVATEGAVVRVEGTIDRIDTAGPRLRIVDYKSGKAGRHHNLAAKIDRGVRLQLALYALAAAEFLGAGPEDVSGVIRPLVAGDQKKFDFELADRRERLLETLSLFLRAIRGGVFPAFPDDDEHIGSCKYCPVNHSCRTRHDLDERNAVRRHEDARTLISKGDG